MNNQSTYKSISRLCSGPVKSRRQLEHKKVRSTQESGIRVGMNAWFYRVEIKYLTIHTLREVNPGRRGDND